MCSPSEHLETVHCEESVHIDSTGPFCIRLVSKCSAVYLCYDTVAILEHMMTTGKYQRVYQKEFWNGTQHFNRLMSYQRWAQALNASGCDRCIIYVQSTH